MPSVLVLVLGDDASLATAADAVAAGAKQIRFTEVTVRALVPDVFRYRAFDDDAAVSSYDGVVIVAPNGAVAMPDAVAQLGRAGSGVETVLGRVGGDASLAAALVETGGIVVSAASSADDAPYATGARVARVAGWVRHALGHEADETHHHHDHEHAHGHHHDHGHQH